MDEIFKQYGSAIITVLAIIALIGIITFVISGNGSIVSDALSELITNFYTRASDATSGAGTSILIF